MTIKFDMEIGQNFAAFYDQASGTFVAVESFDNYHFEIRIGTLESTMKIGTLVASSDAVLNGGLARLLEMYEQIYKEIPNGLL